MKTIYDPRYVAMIGQLKARRRRLGRTQQQVTRQLGVERSWLGKVEQRERRLDVLETWQLCRIYGITLSDLEAVLAAEEPRR